MGKRKCVICSKYIEKDEESVPYKKRYAHVSCFNSAMKLLVTEKKKDTNKSSNTKTKKNVKVLDKPLTEKESLEKKNLINYIRKLTGKDSIEAKVYMLIKKYKADFPYFTYLGIQNTLKYYFEIKENQYTNDNFMGIVPYYYDEAEQYFKKLDSVNKYNKENAKNIHSLYKPKKISITPPKTEIKQIDISKIGEKI